MKKFIVIFAVAAALMLAMAIVAYAAPDVSGVISQTWTDTQTQIKNVVNTVVFPALDMVLAIFFFIKLGGVYFDYRKHGQVEWTAPVILMACLIFTLSAPLYIWQILGM